MVPYCNIRKYATRKRKQKQRREIRTLTEYKVKNLTRFIVTNENYTDDRALRDPNYAAG